MIGYVVIRQAIVVFTFLALAVIVGVLAHRPSRRASRLGMRGTKRRQAIEQSAPWASLEPLVRWSGVQVSRFVSEPLRAKLDARLTHAGDVLGLTADEYAATTFLGAVAGLGAGLGLRALAPSLGPLALAGGVSLGAFLPSFLVEARMKDRQLRIRRGLPYVLDVLCLALGAGADFTAAVGQVVDKARSNEDVREEFAYFLQQLQMGHSRLSALRELAQRVPIAPVLELALAVQLAEERGSSVIATLEIQAAASRNARSNEAERAAQAASTKLLVPMFGFSALSLYLMFSTISAFETSLMSGFGGGT